MYEFKLKKFMQISEKSYEKNQSILSKNRLLDFFLTADILQNLKLL